MQDKKIKLISIIIAAYNRHDFLELILLALAEQDCPAGTFEVIVAQDGEFIEIAELVAKLKEKLPYHLVHVNQPNQGFRAGMMRNKAVAQAEGDYLTFLDGDCLPPKFFVRRQLQLAETGWFVSGNRVLLREQFTDRVLTQKLPIYRWNFFAWLKAQLQGWCNRSLPFVYLPLGILRNMWAPRKWQGAKSCNLAIWRQDFFAVNGYDEQYQGWGYEDSDLIIRLLRNKVSRKIGNFAVPVIHLWHQERSRNLERANYALLQSIQKSTNVYAQDGVNKYLNKQIINKM